MSTSTKPSLIGRLSVSSYPPTTSLTFSSALQGLAAASAAKFPNWPVPVDRNASGELVGDNMFHFGRAEATVLCTVVPGDLFVHG